MLLWLCVCRSCNKELLTFLLTYLSRSRFSIKNSRRFRYTVWEHDNVPAVSSWSLSISRHESYRCSWSKAVACSLLTRTGERCWRKWCWHHAAITRRKIRAKNRRYWTRPYLCWTKDLCCQRVLGQAYERLMWMNYWTQKWKSTAAFRNFVRVNQQCFTSSLPVMHSWREYYGNVA